MDWIFLDESLQSPSQFLFNKKAHPKRHLVCAIISSILCFVTGKYESSINKIVWKGSFATCKEKISKPLVNSFFFRIE
jgi:hypothetical protein